MMRNKVTEMTSAILSIIAFLIGAVVGLMIHLWSGITCALGEWWLGVRELWKSI